MRKELGVGGGESRRSVCYYSCGLKSVHDGGKIEAGMAAAGVGGRTVGFEIGVPMCR